MAAAKRTALITGAGRNIGRACALGLAEDGFNVAINGSNNRDACEKVAAEAEKDANILCMQPDTGERYLSTPLFADVPADMSEEELKISRSTPSAPQFKT